MNKVKLEEMHKIAPLFEGWSETLIQSCLQGYLGDAWTDNIENPQSAQIIAGEFCLFAGKANEELVKHMPASYPFECILVMPQSREWEELIESVYEKDSKRYMRYAIKKEKDVFDVDKLKANIEMLPSKYELKKMGKELFKENQKPWIKEMEMRFGSPERFEEIGLGYMILHGKDIVAMASSYSRYREGIEIDIVTKEEYRRQGLAYICASKLIVECLDRGLYPSWDAANKASVALSEKLGYHFDREYPTYLIKLKKDKL